MIAGGIYLSYGVFNIRIGYQPWTDRISATGLFFVAASFHIGLLCGAVVSNFLYNRFETLKLHVSGFEINHQLCW
jgi:hypothetical protein